MADTAFLVFAIGRRFKRACEDILSDKLPLEIEKAFEHLSDLAPKKHGSPARCPELLRPIE